jgi:hypothetical protein
MRKSTVMVLLLVAAGGCRGMDPRKPQGDGEAQVVALVVRSEPPGAQVRVNKIAKTWTTPCDIADFSLTKGAFDVEVSLAGYQTVVTKVRYDGYDPVQMNVRLLRGAGTAAAVAPPPPEPKIVTTLAAPAAVEAVPQITAVPSGSGTVLRVSSTNAKLRIQAKAVVTDAAKPGEYFLPNVPPDKVLVEFLDPRTDMVLQTVEFEAGVAAPAAVVRPGEPPAPAADRVGEVKVVSKTYGVYVKLDPGLDVQPGEEIIIYREGREVARTKILKIAKADSGYPDGAAQVQKEGSIQKGDEVRRSKP